MSTGNLSHSPVNDTRYQDLIALTEELAAVAGQGADVQVKHLLAVTQSAFEGVVDNTKNKHGDGVDDATDLAERYWKIRNKNVIFNPKAPNQQKTISCIRQCITLGRWSKGDPDKLSHMISEAMTNYQRLREDPATSKRLIDAANYLIAIARRMKKSDYLLEDEELQSLAMKNDASIPTVEGVLDNYHKGLKKLYEGKHAAGSCNSPNIEKALMAINKELKSIAEEKRSATIFQLGEDITKEADRLAKEETAKADDD